jgi:predicted nucleic acid-binding protein
MTILFDNTVLSNFAIIQKPDLIQQAFIDEPAITEQVFQELQVGVNIGRLPICNWTWLKRITLTSDENLKFCQLSAYLGKGESSCLAVASQRGYNLATDDKDARQWARRMNIPHTGTLGILATLVKRRIIPLADGNEWLYQMIESGYHSPIAELNAII